LAKDSRKPHGDVERFERHQGIRRTHDNAREQHRQRHQSKEISSVSDEDQKVVVSLGFNSVGFYARTVRLLFLSHLL
jgi:hypothetical protein